MNVETSQREIGIATGGNRSRRRPARSKRGLVAVAIGGVLLLASAGYGYHWWRVDRFIETTDDAYVGGDVTPIAPRVSGFVAQILVADNQFVRAGRALIRLDPRDFAAALARARAVVRSRVAALAELGARRTLQSAMIRRAAAELAACEAEAQFAAQDEARYRLLAGRDAASRQDAERAEAARRSATASVTAAQEALVAAREQLVVLEAETVSAQAEIAAAEAGLRQARLDLGYTTISAPIDGYVGDRYAQVGSYVSAGTDLLSIVPARGLWVDANFKEDSLAHMRPGDAATIVADILPGRTFHGHVLSLAPATGAVFSVIPPQNATGNFTKIVQRVPVRIALDGQDSVLGLLRPGLSTTVNVITRAQSETMSVAP
ncbi:MAG TPA: HlyD family secretion protein [Acetobacteraceae bacterium]|nr:HlyD family secretion protein [Acetobacteraceae bacterium]